VKAVPSARVPVNNKSFPTERDVLTNDDAWDAVKGRTGPEHIVHGDKVVYRTLSP